MTPYNFILLLFSFCAFMLSLMVWLKRQDNLGNIYFLFSFFVAFWGVTFAISFSDSTAAPTALFFSRLTNASAAMIGPTWYHFCSIYAKQNETPFSKRFLKITYVIGCVIVLFAWTPWFVPETQSIVGFKYYATAGPIYYIYTALFFICVITAFVCLFSYLHKTHKISDRRQIKLFILGKLIGFTAGSLTFLPVFKIQLPQYGIFFMPLYPFITAYLVSRQKIFDVEELAEAAHNDKLAAIGILSASINHELRNPLYIIKNFAESLAINTRDGAYPDPAELKNKMLDSLDRITRQSEKAMKIIGRLTAFARKKPDQDFKMVPVSLKTLFEDLDILIRCEIEFRKIRIIQEIPENLPSVFADPAHLEEILLNLILNAYQALKNQPAPDYFANGEDNIEEKQITIQASEEKEKIRISIKDNGPGIPAEDLANIFKPFYTKKKEGLGLGLYITKQLIEKNLGTIKVSSVLGRGTSFILEFNKPIPASSRV